MADYLPLISRAIANLAEDTPETRRAIYERARNALDQQLRSIDPPLADADILRERQALDEAIAQIENEKRVAAAGLIGARPEDETPLRLPDEPLPPADAASATDADMSPPDEVAAPAALRAPPMRLEVPRSRPSPLSAAEPAAEMKATRPRIETKVPRPDRSNRLRGVVVAVVLASVIAAIAGVAITQRSTAPVDVEPRTASPETAAPGDRKFVDRVGGEEPPAAGAAPAPAPVPPAQGAAGAPTSGGLPVAQRAILYEESADNPRVPVTFPGRAVWRLDSVNIGPGQPAETAIRVDLDLPTAGLTLTMLIRRNTDAALPASHLVQLSFVPSGSAQEQRQVRDIGVLQMKPEENARGTPLAGLPVPVTPNVFLIGLSNIRDDMQRNIDMLKTSPWIDLPIRYASGRRAIIAIERGPSGERAVTDAFAAWGQ